MLELSYQELAKRYQELLEEFQSYREMVEAWKTAKQRFYSLSNRTQDGIYSFNLSIKKYVYTNPAFIRMFGHPCKDIVTTESVEERIYEDDRVKRTSKIEASLRENKDGDEVEYRCYDHEGNIRWMHDRWIILKDFKGKPTAIEGIVRDITDIKQIISLKDYLESLLESCMDAIIVTDNRGLITFVNKGAEDLLGRKREHIIGSCTIGDLLKDSKNRERDIFDFIIRCGPYSNYELDAALSDGRIIPLLVSSSFLKNDMGERIGTISYVRDISMRKQAEEHIRMLSRQLIRAQEIERSSIARDLHDHLAQNLYSFNIQLVSLLNRLMGEKESHRTEARKLLDTLKQIIGDVRRMVFSIHPASLDTLGLTDTVLNHCRHLAQLHKLRIDFKTAGIDTLSLDFDTKIAIYRIIQEALNNIVKHAEATSAAVRLVYSYPKIILRIEDNGKGFDPSEKILPVPDEGCMGIRSMKERVALLDGKMLIKSAPGRGTSISIEIPYDTRKNREDQKKNSSCR